MTTLKTLLLAFATLFFIGCEELEFGDDFLKKPSSTDITMDTVYANIINANKALTAAYSTLPYRLPYKWQVGKNMMNMDVTESLTDLCQSYLAWGGVSRYYYSGIYTASLMNPPTETDEKKESWHSRYHFSLEGSWVGIRRALLFIENIDRVPDVNQETKDRLKGEAYMIMAVHYTELYRNFGGLPWIDKTFSPGDDLNGERLTAEATADKIAELCDNAAEVLPWALDDISNEEGRFTKASAMGLKVRVLLFSASPIFNSNEKYRDGEACDQKIMWHGSYDVRHWQKVIDASEDFINELNSWGAYGMVYSGNPRADFKSGYYDRGTGECLITTRQFYKNTFNSGWGLGAFLWWCNEGVARPTQELVDLYPMTNGKAISDPSSGYDPENPYANRDPRLYETVIVNGDQYRGRTAELWTGGRERTSLSVKGAGTGYMLRKFYLDGDNATSYTSVVQWPYLRLPEIFLSYAEALNAVNGPSPEAYNYLNMTRTRVGIGGAPEGLNKEEFKEEILKERAREFCMEEVRWYDLVRYKKPFIQPHGIEITKQVDGSLNYEVVSTDKDLTRYWVNNWDTKWYFGAIPADEVNKDYGVIQNPGW